MKQRFPHHPDRNAPPGRRQALQYLETEIAVKPGETITLRALNSLNGISFKPLAPGKKASKKRVVKPAVPPWHFPMLEDDTRNTAYKRAIEKAVDKTSGARVLDIGAGTGLLAMIAAESGAESIVSCEMIPHIAATAKEILAANGFGDKIDLIPKASLEMNIPADMKRPANIMVSETVDHSLLGEGFLKTLEHAHANLLEEDAVIIPGSATVYAAGIELRTEKVGPFHAETLNMLRLNRYDSLQRATIQYRPLTDVFEAFSFNFYDGRFEPEKKQFEIPVTDDGSCNAIAFWYDLRLDDEIIINTGPDSLTTCWKQAVNFFDREIPVKKGSVLPVSGGHDLSRIYFSVEPLECILRGISIDLSDYPGWFKKLIDEEKEFPKHTKEIEAMMRLLPPERRDKILGGVISDAVTLGFDPIIVSDFVTQLGYY